MKQNTAAFPVRELTIAGNPISKYRICYDRTIPGAYANMAHLLQQYIAYTCGKVLSIRRGVWGDEECEILIGPCSRNPDVSHLPEDSVYIEVKGARVHLTGSGRRGPIYAVFTFLEEFLGWRFFTPTLEVCTPAEHLDVPSGARYVFTPPFSYRETSWAMTRDVTYSVKRGLNAGIGIPPSLGGNIGYVRGHGCHTFDDFMLKRNYPDHPEYFADIHGENQNDDTTPPPEGQEELCLTNPDVIRIVTEKVGEWLRSEQDPRLISISQNDNANGYCRCKNCAAQGTPTDNYLKFISKIADHYKDEFPKVTFEMLAYQYTQDPPSKGVRVPKNVGARLCSIRTCGAHAHTDTSCPGHMYGGGSPNRKFVECLEGWAKVCKNVSVWDYTTDFAFYISPYPNFEVIRQNIAFHKKAGTRRLFCQGNNCLSGEFGELRGYLISKMLWNPAMSKKEYYRHMNEFLAAYYGEGWRSIRAYIDLCEKKAHVEGNHFGYYVPPAGYYSKPEADCIIPRDEAFLTEALALWERAARRTKGETCRKNLERSRLSIRHYALCATWKERWEEGDEASRREYEEEAARFRDDVILSRVAFAEGLFLPHAFSPDKPPHTWTGKPL